VSVLDLTSSSSGLNRSDSDLSSSQQQQQVQQQQPSSSLSSSLQQRYSESQANHEIEKLDDFIQQTSFAMNSVNLGTTTTTTTTTMMGQLSPASSTVNENLLEFEETKESKESENKVNDFFQQTVPTLTATKSSEERGQSPLNQQQSPLPAAASNQTDSQKSNPQKRNLAGNIHVSSVVSGFLLYFLFLTFRPFFRNFLHKTKVNLRLVPPLLMPVKATIALQVNSWLQRLEKLIIVRRATVVVRMIMII
jgi:hypothetical protein